MPQTADKLDGRLMDTRRDSADFRDRVYQPALVALARQWIPERDRIVILDQGREGACTGFGLAGTINYLNRSRGVDVQVSPRMLYEMAKYHDRWPGEDYEGSSARGAVKGWHKNGVCAEVLWPYDPNRPGYLSYRRRLAALKYPLGAYYRVLKRRSDMHAALQETGAVFVTAAVHAGWNRVGRDGRIPDQARLLANGGHAFCVLGYTDEGFIIQNSWGERWGGVTLNGVRYPGLAIWQYRDFDRNYWDGWVVRIALPVESLEALQGGNIVATVSGAERVQRAPMRHEIVDHYIHIDDGQFDPRGDYPSSREETRELIDKAVQGGDGGRPEHILLYAHGGLNSVKDSAIRVGKWRPVFEVNRVHEIHFIWETGFLAELKDILLGRDDFASRRAGGFGDWKDRWIERLTQGMGHALWKEMSEDARLGFRNAASAGTQTLKYLKNALAAVPRAERPRVHMMGHSAGSIWLGYLLEKWLKMGGQPVESLQLFAPACTMEFYDAYLKTALGLKKVNHLIHYYLDDETERDDNVARIYGKSLLYLVSRAFQSKTDVVPLMGMARYWEAGKHPGVSGYNTRDNPDRTRSDSHGGFDNDPVTMNQALETLLGRKPDSHHVFRKEHLSGY